MASKEHIRGVHKTPALENDGPKLVMLNDSGKFSPRNDQGLHWSFRRTERGFFQDLLQTAKTVGVTEVKDEDLFKGIAQNAVQLESALSNRKRYFMECSLDDQDRLKFKLSEPGVVVYKDESMWRVIKKHRSCGYKLCEDVFSVPWYCRPLNNSIVEKVLLIMSSELELLR
ncbi:hypothetical protein GLOIN_2v1779223 [Rhizophagus irregularis DAOM 181602=DAOM 197198]|nr:hypothetical protein GLOIN_2v1779223 [Rhizophagus irregularis DAOM 181602=DAOM 197198]